MNTRRAHPLQHASRSRLIAALAAGVLSGAALAESALEAVEFNPTLIRGSQASQETWSRFGADDLVPGTYSADVRVNNTFIVRHDVEVRAMDDGDAQVCMDPALFEHFSLNTTRLAQAVEASAASDKPLRPLPTEVFCDALSYYVPDATATLDLAEQVFSVSIPQLYLARDPRGWVSPELRDNGINAARLNYSINHQQLMGGNGNYSATGVMLHGGVNLGAWRFRHDGRYAYDADGSSKYTAGRTVIQRDLPSLDAQLTLGESSTKGELFEGVSFRGVNISTDTRMLANSQTGYAPTVRGVAQTHARVVIRQHDRVVYDAMVAPGPFEIDDLGGGSYNGDLNVEVTEADGRVQRFVVPFAAVPQMLRSGQQRYSVTAGQLNESGLGERPYFAEATLRRGLNDRFTAFGGVTAANGYGAVLVGGAVSTPLGAFSGDVTFAKTNVPGANMSGQSYRLTYSQDLPSTNTNITLAAYRYSTQGYLSLRDAARARDHLRDGAGNYQAAHQRSRVDLTIHQNLGQRGGTVYLNASSSDYWSSGQRTTGFSAGYSNTWGSVTYSISAHRTMESSLFSNGPSRQNTSINLNLSIPLGKASSAPRLSTSMSRDSDGQQSMRAGVTSVFGERQQGHYDVSASHSSQENVHLNAGVGYATAMANVAASLSGGRDSQQFSLSASGGLILHSGGLVLSQHMSETVGIVHVPNGPGALIEGGSGLKTDSRGYAVVPHVTPYRRSTISVDPTGMPLDVELKSASVTMAPTAGAVVRMVVPTVSGRTAMIAARRAEGQPLPFGRDVTDEAGKVVGVVGQASRLWVRGVEEAGQLFVRWGEEAAQVCTVNYNLENVASGDIVASECLDQAPTESTESTEATTPVAPAEAVGATEIAALASQAASPATEVVETP